MKKKTSRTSFLGVHVPAQSIGFGNSFTFADSTSTPSRLPFERWGLISMVQWQKTSLETAEIDGMSSCAPDFASTSDSDHAIFFGASGDIEQMEENSEFIARTWKKVGQARSAANVRTKAQAEAMRKRSGFDENTPDCYFKVGDMVKMKHHDRLKLEFKWKGPYHVVDVGHPGTYWIMTPQGLRLPNAVNQNDLAPWLSPVVDNVDFFYDGTSRSSGSF
ncbi:hypothetical protein BASA83_010535 [Batrachochytrium salamandrivorans]|nr:hypothetical protein BASA83_010535 [Batrachochytrium salamandrivorans]